MMGTDEDFAASIRKNIELTNRLFAKDGTPEVIGTVCGSESARAFWQSILERARIVFKAREAISFHEDLPTNQAFGLLLLWQRLKKRVRTDRGAMAAFVFGDGTRSTPFTETDNAQKPAIATYVKEAPEKGACFLTMVEVALRYFTPVQQFLVRSGFHGLVVKWGDEVQIPTLDLSGSDELFRDADVVRFVSLREITADEAANKDWVGVNEKQRVTAFIPRRPLTEMERLAERGLVQRKDGRLFGGINLGSIAVSYDLLDALWEEFQSEVNDPNANRKDRPALDPEFFTALTVAAIKDPACREAEWKTAVHENADVKKLNENFPDIIDRLRRALAALEAKKGSPIQIVAMNFGDQFWGDIGQHPKIFQFYMALNDRDAAGQISRALAGIGDARDENGNLILHSSISPKIRVSDSVLIDVTLTGEGEIQDSVLIGTRARNVKITQGFDMMSTVTDLEIVPRGGTYKVVSRERIHAESGERLTTLFLPGRGALLFRVKESTNLKDKQNHYEVPVCGNPLSFQEAHRIMGRISVEELRDLREAEIEKVLAEIV